MRHVTRSYGSTRAAGWSAGLALVLALLLPAAAGAAGGAHVDPGLLARAQGSPQDVFHVIVQGDRTLPSHGVAAEVAGANGRAKQEFVSVDGVSADLSGADLVKLARRPHVAAITEDAPLASASYQNGEWWRQTTDMVPLLGTSKSPAPQAPAIAVVDSGVDASDRSIFGSRVVASVNFSSLSTGTADLEGHGTMVAGIAAGAPATGNGFQGGVAQNAPIVSVRTSDAYGKSLTSDVIAACDWILANKARYSIGVANFSLVGSTRTSFRYDPLDRAVEKLWFNGIVVVASSGNHGVAGSAVDMSLAPGNDPFVITVGALDQHGDGVVANDTAAPWSAYGHTGDGFAKPEVSAPGRYAFMPTPYGSWLTFNLPDRLWTAVYGGISQPKLGATTLMWMSGSSFSAPIVSGAAAQIMARHRNWTPDQVKGALMLTARYVPLAGWSAGVGEIDAALAAGVIAPPNPNENLDAFIVTDPLTGQKRFDSAGWAGAVSASPSWSTANWDSANWDSANWDSASWTSANWDSANWDSANWDSANWDSANWDSSLWTSADWASDSWPE